MVDEEPLLRLCFPLSRVRERVGVRASGRLRLLGRYRANVDMPSPSPHPQAGEGEIEAVR